MKEANRQNMVNHRAIPVVDLHQYDSTGADGNSPFVKALGNAFREVGFVGIVNHGVDTSLIDAFYEASNRFFGLPEAIKWNYEIPGLAGQRGYTSFGKEHARQSDVADLKEFFQIGQDSPPPGGDPSEYPPNVVVTEVPELSELGARLYQSFEQVGRKLLSAIALYLNLPVHFFEEKVDRGNSILRAIHYPPITREPASAIRAEQHEDINLITLLVGASAGGLQILGKDGMWLPVIPEENEIVVNVGDMLQRLTNNYLCSTTHRVANPPREEWHKPRLSIPFFMHPRSNMDLTCLPGCVDENHPPAWAPITAGEYLNERLREIGLKK